MKSVLVIFLATFLQCNVNNAVVLKRQVPGFDSACFTAVAHLSSREMQCLGSLGGSGSGYYSDDDAGYDDYGYDSNYYTGLDSLNFAGLCTDSFCSNVIINKVIPNCKVSIQLCVIFLQSFAV